MMPTLKPGALAVSALTVVALAGCSQAAQFQPVAGDAVTSVRIATIDVAQQQGLTVTAAPVCDYAGTEFDCRGSLTDGRQLTSTATQVTREEVPAELAGQLPPDAPGLTKVLVLDVMVDGQPIYRGLANAVLDENGREQS